MAEGLPPTRSPLRTIFVDTSIGTHLAVAVSIHDAIGDVKAKIKADHALCFQEVGEITITAIKVRRRRLFYSLADAMPVVNAFEGVIGSWFMCVDVAPMCFSKNNEVTNGKVMHDQLEHDDSAVRIDAIEEHPERIFCGFSSKNIDDDNMKFLAQDGNRIMPAISINPEWQNPPVASLNELTSTANPSMPCERTSSTLLSEALPTDELIAGNRSVKTLSDIEVAEPCMQKRIVMPPFEAKEKSSPDEKEIHNLISASIDHEHELEIMINHEKHGSRKKHDNKSGVEACDGMLSPSSISKTISRKRRKTLQCDDLLESLSQHHPPENRKQRKVKVAVRGEHDEDLHSGNNFRLVENIGELDDSVNASQGICLVGKTDIVGAPIEGESSKLPEEGTIEVQNACIEKRKKKTKKKSMNCHEEVHLSISSENPVVQSPPELLTYPRNSCIKTDASVERYPIEADHDGVLEDMTKKINVKLTDLEGSQISQSDFRQQRIVCSSIGKSKSESSKILDPKEINDALYGEFNVARPIVKSNLRKNEDEFVDPRTSVSSSAEKTLGHVQSAHMTTNDVSSDKWKGNSKETDNGANREEANKDTSNIATRPSRSKKKSKNESYRDGDAEKIIKEANPIADSGQHLDTMLNTSSCKRTPEGYQVSNMNSVDSQINMTPTLTLGSFAAVEQDKENKMPSHHASEVRVKTRRNKLKSRSKGQMDISNEGTGGRPSNLVNGSNQTVQQHYLNAMVTMPSVDEDLSKQDEIPLKKSVDSSSAKYLQLNEIANGDDKGKEGDLTHVLSVGAAVDQTKSKSKKKHKMEVSSKRHIELEHCEHNFVDYFVPNEGSHNPAVSMVDMSSKKSNARKKAKTSRKIQTSQLQQESDTELMKNASHERHHGKSQPQENDFIYHDRVGSVERAVTRDSVIGDALKAKSSKQSSRQICSESDLFLSETTDLDNLGKKLKDHRDQPSVQRLKKGDVMYEQSKHTNSSGDGNCDGDNLVTKDEGTQQMIHHSSTSDAPCSNLFTISPSDGMTTIAAPSDSAEDTPYQLRRYKVVRKLLNRRSEKVMNSNFEKSLAVPSGRTFDDVSDSDMNPEEMMTKTTALKSRMETNSSASDADSDEQDETNEKADGNLSELSRRKLPLSVILKSSSMYKKAKLGVLQSELEAETGSQPVDVVLETQPEPSSS